MTVHAAMHVVDKKYLGLAFKAVQAFGAKTRYGALCADVTNKSIFVATPQLESR